MTITMSKQRISDFQSHANSHVQEIREAGDQAWHRVSVKGEVAIVRDFLIGKGRGTDYLNRNLAHLLGGNGRVVKFASIFLHQMRYVIGLRKADRGKQTKLSRCELGDLQTLFLYLDQNKSICQARSVIFQAKLKPHTGSHVIDHPQQRELYDTCPSFQYESILKGEKRGLPSDRFRERALQYIFVGNRPVQVRTIPSDMGQGATENYGEHLLRLLNDSTGLDVPPDQSTDNIWGRIVWDMIEYVAAAVTKRTPTRKSGLDELLKHFNHFENHDKFAITVGGRRLGKNKGGFGLQFIIVWDSELGEKPPGKTNIQPKIEVTQTIEPGMPGGKLDLESANIRDMLADLELARAQVQTEILFELDRRVRYRSVSEEEAHAIYKVLPRICSSLPNKTASIAYQLLRNLESKMALTQKVYVGY
jgi:hypothetical protein